MATESVSRNLGETGVEAPTGVSATRTYSADELAEHRALMDRILEEGGKRIRASVARLIALGIVDKDGNRLKKELPADMQPDVDRDFGG